MTRSFPARNNARRDNLEGFWKAQFGHTHGVMLASAFYENVNRHKAEGRELRDGEAVENMVLEFRPRPQQDMLVACLWSRWTGKDEPDLLSFAAITDEPPAEVAAAGHDRCIIPIRPEHIDAWLNRQPNDVVYQSQLLLNASWPHVLLIATAPASCRKCGGPIASGEQVSWVDRRDHAGTSGPYHIACTPLMEDVDIARIAALAAATTKSEMQRAVGSGVVPEGRVGLVARIKRQPMLLTSSVCVAGTLLLIAALFRLPYEFYAVLRVVVFGTCALLALDSWRNPNNGWRIGLVALAALYNPFVPIHLSRSTWVPVNVATVAALVLVLYHQRTAKDFDGLE